MLKEIVGEIRPRHIKRYYMFCLSFGRVNDDATCLRRWHEKPCKDCARLIDVLVYAKG